MYAVPDAEDPHGPPPSVYNAGRHPRSSVLFGGGGLIPGNLIDELLNVKEEPREPRPSGLFGGGGPSKARRLMVPHVACIVCIHTFCGEKPLSP